MLIVARRQSHLVFWVVNFLLVGSNPTFHAVVDAGKHYLDSIKKGAEVLEFKKEA